jgi:hypothetical protein
MPTPPHIDACNRVLIVEGYSDLLFYAELLEFIGKLDGVFIKHFNGREDLAVKLETFLSPQLLQSKSVIGIIVDADADASAVATQLTQVLLKASGQTVKPGAWTNGNPRIGLFIAPDGKSKGEIESLVWQAWAADPNNTRPKQCVEAFVNCMKTAGFEPHSPDKGYVSSLLAIRNDDDPRLGPGARTRKIFDFNRSEYTALKTFLSGI